MSSIFTPAFVPGQRSVLQTINGTVVVLVRDMQKRATNFAFLVESLTTGELFVAWPEEAMVGAMRGMSVIKSKTPLDQNPNVDLIGRCFTSRSYIPF